MKFVAQVKGFDVKDSSARIRLDAPADQLGRVVKMLVYVAVQPKEFDFRLMRKGAPGVACRAMLRNLSVGWEGDSRISVETQDKALPMKVLWEMVDELVVVDVRDAGAVDSDEEVET